MADDDAPLTDGPPSREVDPEAPADVTGEVYDVIIVGAGIAGLSAAIYTTRERLGTLLLERQMAGGQILLTARVENYPGFPEPINGMELADRLTQQAKRFGARLETGVDVQRLEAVTEGDERLIVLHARDEKRYRGRAVILAVGSEYRKLGAPGEKRLSGYGVSYCGTCDAPFYRDKHVVVVGGGDTALDEGIHILKFAEHVTFVLRGEEFRAEQILLDELAQYGDRVTVLKHTAVDEILGDQRVEAVFLRDLESGKQRTYDCDGVFVFIGLDPNTEWLKGTVDMTPGGFIRTDACRLGTSMEGVWAAGDVRTDTLKQAATAAADGVTAALNAKEYLRGRGTHKART